LGKWRKWRVIVQIYEIQTPAEAEKCIEAGVDHVGSVLLPGMPWQQSVLKETFSVSQGTEVKNSLISLSQDADTLHRVLDYYQPDYIHFCEDLTDNHGGEIDLDKHVDLQMHLRESFSEVRIMRSIPVPVKNAAPDFPTLKIAERMEPVSDIFLTDTWLEQAPVGGFIGITGRPCDWKRARELVLQSNIPVILAGGLSPDNVFEGLMEVGPAGADSCTQTNKRDKEGNPMRFEKDFERVKRFVQEVRKAEALS
jgi:phosphoribosylanthranilate isomerase